jgi:hypothetical protein
MHLMQSCVSLAGLLAQSGFDLGPVLLPTSRTEYIAQGQHGIDMFFCPVHAWAFQACVHDQFVATLHHATPNRPTLGLKEWVLHLGFSFFQVSQIARDALDGGIFSL